MLIDGPGRRDTASYPVPGGTATLHQRAVIVSGPGFRGVDHWLHEIRWI